LETLSFSQKLAARNVFRYKQRLLMTVIGIAGCTAFAALTGFGLKDSINAIVGKQFDEIFLYDGLGHEQHRESRRRKPSWTRPSAARRPGKLSENPVRIRSGGRRPFQPDLCATLLVPSQSEPFERYFDLHERVSVRKRP
jgi:putative ABC transport system permease protein